MTFTEYGISADAVDCYMHLWTVHNSWLGWFCYLIFRFVSYCMGSNTLCRCEHTHTHTHTEVLFLILFHSSLYIFLVWLYHVEHLLAVLHHNYMSRVIWKWWRFKWLPWHCILLAMTLGNFGFLNTHCMLTVPDLQCERFVPLCWNNLRTLLTGVQELCCYGAN